MTALIILQFAEMFTAYAALTVLLPYVLFRRILKGRRLAEQFLMTYTFGNFYLINIVFALSLLHISNQYTLILLTAALSLLIWTKVNRFSWKRAFQKSGTCTGRLVRGSLGKKEAMFRTGRWTRRICKKGLRWCEEKIIRRPVKFFFFVTVCAALFWIYGRQLLVTYGYCASDIPVHLEWINEMSRDNLFSDGVYPFGFHCIIYYLHTVFQMDTYVLMCEFNFVQTIFVHLVLLAILKEFCRSQYLAYAGTLVYILGSFWGTNTFSRFFSSLPQEFGMIFVIPSVYFLIRFFQTKKENLKSKETKLMLGCFAFAFALTLAIHFYGTMIAGLCCIGIACGYFRQFLQKEYFRRIMLTGILSIMMAVLPMVIAYIGGTPLQGSLGWGLSVINGDSSNQTAVATSVQPSATNASGTSGAGNGMGDPSASGEMESEAELREQPEGGVQALLKKAAEILWNLIKKVAGVFARAWNSMADQIGEMEFGSAKKWYGHLILISYGLLFLLGVFRMLRPGRTDGSLLLSMVCCMGILTLLLCAKSFHLPTLMDSPRCSIYYAYLLVVTETVLVDALFAFLPAVWISGVASIALTVALAASGVKTVSSYDSSYVTNGAYVCLTNIILENEDEKWTIVSANDELQMGIDHGWHYETSLFLAEMEILTEETKIRIPTEKVYIFIEKIPVNYSAWYQGSGQSISTKGALQSLPVGSGISMYQGDNRWIIMSRMYYWAQAFQEMYPNEMKVYYESDDFICYEISQNMYHQYNFAIDYGYNQVQMQEEGK